MEKSRYSQNFETEENDALSRNEEISKRSKLESCPMPSLKIKGGNPAGGDGAHSCRFYLCFFLVCFLLGSLWFCQWFMSLSSLGQIESNTFIFF